MRPAAAVAPAAPTLSLPADAATDVSITPVLACDPVAGATAYYTEVAKSAEFMVLVFEDTVTTPSAKIGALEKNTKYYWHMATANPDGYSDFSATRSFTTGTADPVPDAPVLVSPANHATGIGYPARLRWNPVPGAVSYTVGVSTSAAFTTTAFTGSTTHTFIEVPGLAKATTYHWRVVAVRAPNHSVPSAGWSFTTVAADGPGLPTGLTPTNGKTGVALRPVLSWVAATAATSYSVQVASDAEFAVPVFSATVTTTSVEVPTLAKGTKYYWRVLAKNSAGQSAWTAAQWFLTTSAEPPAAPVLSSPADGASGASTTPVLSWAAALGATGYLAQISTSPTFSPVVWSSAATSTSVQATGLLPGTAYYWRVQASSTAGAGPWSVTRSFVTSGVEKPAAPVLYAVANGATAVPVSTHLVWLAAARATRYNVQVSTNAEFTHITWSQEVNGGVTGADPIGLVAGTTYYWRVMAANNIGSSAWSTVWHFTTKAASSGS